MRSDLQDLLEAPGCVLGDRRVVQQAHHQLYDLREATVQLAAVDEPDVERRSACAFAISERCCELVHEEPCLPFPVARLEP